LEESPQRPAGLLQVVAMSTVSDPQFDATKTFHFLTSTLLCARPCPCTQAASRSSGQVHCPGCTGAVPTLEIAVKGGILALRCSGGCLDENVWVAVADLLADGDLPEVYRYVDTAVGGTDHRNRVREAGGFQPVGRTDVYATYQRATIGLDYYIQLHRNKDGNPSVEKYPGRLWTPLFPIDIDDADLRVSLAVACQIIHRLDGLGVPLKAVRCYFSGSKGFSIELPATLFGGFDPSTDLPRRLNRAAALLLPEIEYDASIYSLLRLWRVPNSRHGTSGLYKVPFTAGEILTLDIDQIREMAVRPRPVEDHPELTPVPDDEWFAVEALVEIWARAEQAVDDDGATRERRRGTVTDEARDRQTVAAVVASWPANKNADLPEEERNEAGQISRHHDYLMPIVGFLARRTSDEHLVGLLVEAAEQSRDRDFLTGRDYHSEIERLVASSSERVGKGQRTVGLPTLAEKFPTLADVLEALWPAQRINFSDDGFFTPESSERGAGSNTEDEPGHAVLDDVHAFLGRFVAYPTRHAHLAHTLWIVHTHLMGAWESTPRIAFLSPEPGSGKTRALEITELLVPLPVEAVNVTPAYLFRKVGDKAGTPTILYDEIDTVFGPKAKDNEEIRGLLNAGHRRGAVAGRCVVKGKNVETEEIPAYCAVALAGIGWLPDTILSRAIVVRMRRRAPGETIEPYRRRVHAREGHPIRDQLAIWARSVQASVSDAWPVMPTGIVDRDSDVWEPLLAVADAAGGDWPERARYSAVALVAASRESVPSLGLRLLADLRTVFGDRLAMPTDQIVAALTALDEAPWGEISKGKPLNALALAQRLRQYGVTSKNIRVGTIVSKGYVAEDLADAWSRYLPPSSHKAATAATDGPPPSGQDVADGDDGAATAATDVGASTTDDEPDLCVTCGVNPVGLAGLDCEECMGVDE
jgi:Protein of unknown function (DUF3631)